MQQCRLASVIEPKEEEFGMLVQEAQRGEYIPDCMAIYISDESDVGLALEGDRWEVRC